MVRVLLNAPKQVPKGQPFNVKLLISHPMESGQRRDTMGKAIPRDIVNLLVCKLDQEEVFRMNLYPAIAANPFLVFSAIAEQSGTLTITFTDDDGVVQTETAAVEVV